MSARHAEPKRRLQLWEAGEVHVLVGRIPGQQHTGEHNFEDDEAAIKMIIKGRSPTVRHVSRTHRVELDWLFDRTNLDPQIQIKYVDTKNPTRKLLSKIRVLRTAQGIENWIRVNVSARGGKLLRNSNQDPTTYCQERPQDDTQSSSHRKLGRNGESASPAPGNWREVRTSKSEGQGWNSTCRSPIDTLSRCSRTCGKKLNLAEEAPVIGTEAVKTNVLIW